MGENDTRTGAPSPPADSKTEQGDAGEALVSRAARHLELNAGYVLIVLGATMIGLATWRADKAAIAPLLVVFGAAILGAFYSRIEGGVEATRDGVKLVVREVREFASRKGLTSEETVILIERVLARWEPKSRSRTTDLETARRATDETLREAAVTLAERHDKILKLFAAWLQSEGWEDIRQQPGAAPDLLAFRRDEMLVAEVKLASTGVRPDLAQTAIRHVQSIPQSRPVIHRALVLPVDFPGFSYLGAKAITQAEIEVYLVSEDGQVERFDPPFENRRG